MMVAILACALVFGLLSRLGRNAGGLLIGFCLTFLTPIVLFVISLARLFRADRLTRPLITCPLLGVSVFGWPAMFVGVFVPEPLRPKLLVSSLVLGALVGVLAGFHSRLVIKKVRATNQIYPNDNAAWLNACLSASVLAMLVGWEAISWLTWDVGRSGLWLRIAGREGFRSTFMDVPSVRRLCGSPWKSASPPGASSALTCSGFGLTEASFPMTKVQGRAPVS